MLFYLTLHSYPILPLPLSPYFLSTDTPPQAQSVPPHLTDTFLPRILSSTLQNRNPTSQSYPTNSLPILTHANLLQLDIMLDLQLKISNLLS